MNILLFIWYCILFRGLSPQSELLYPTISCGRCPLVGLSGLEPPTSRLSGARSNLLSYKPMLVVIRFHQVPKRDLQFAERIAIACGRLSAGGDDGIRTHDPLLAGQVLSQLSYTPILVYVLLFLRNIK